MSTSQIYDLSIRIRIRYRMLNIRTRIRTDLNPSKRIRSRIRSENICTVFIPTCTLSLPPAATPPTSSIQRWRTVGGAAFHLSSLHSSTTKPYSWPIGPPGMALPLAWIGTTWLGTTLCDTMCLPSGPSL
jgi:hypothetical protein